jgi:aminoglycoside phosphotransferase (APT) family kinase protein
MAKDANIKITHADLHPTNVMVSASGPPHVLALIDWGQSGWYPDYWEYAKMSYTVWSESEWLKKWVPEILEPRDDENLLMAEYTMTIGAI